MSCGGTTTTKGSGHPYTPEQMRRFLASYYPKCFKPKGALKLPLKIGIHDDIKANHSWLSMDEIKAGLKDYTDGPKYLGECRTGAWRVDLDGRPVSMVTPAQQQHSVKRLDALRKDWANEGRSLGDILADVLKPKLEPTMNEISHNSFLSADVTRSPAPGMLDARSIVDTVRFQSNDAAAKTIASRDQQLIKYGESRNDGLVAFRARAHSSMERVVRELRNGRKIEAIKEYRNFAGVGLKEAKDFVESLQGMPGAAVSPPQPDYDSKSFLVLTQEAGESTTMYREGFYSMPSVAEDAARRAAARSPDDTVILARVIGRTKSVFSMA